jgi:TP901 family phage tail tape measure protein
MTLKEYLIKTSYDNAGMTQFKQDCETAAGAAKRMGVSISQDAEVLDRSVKTGMTSAGKAFRDVTTVFSQGGKDISLTFRDMGNAIELNSMKMKEGKSSAMSLWQELEKVGGRALLVAPAWLALRFAMTEVIQLFQQSIAFMVDWEEQMSRIRVVTGASKEQIDVISGSIQAVAEKFAVSNKEVAESANQWLRMGATLSTVQPLLEATAKLSLISGQSLQDSGTKLNSIVSAFGLSANQASAAVDNLIGVEEKSGVSLEVLLDGFSKAGVKAQQSGISFDQLAGYIAAVNQKTRQSGELIGTQLASMFTRLGTTGIAASQALSGVNFYLDATGKQTNIATPQLRRMDDIIKELAESWKTMSTAQQDALAKALGGNLRATTVIALMENFNAALKASGESAKSGQDSVNAALDTTAKHINQLQTSWGQFVNSINASGVIKTFIDNVKQRVDLLTVGITLAHAAWDRLFNRAEFDKRIAAFKELQESQKKAASAQGGATPGATVNKNIPLADTEAQIQQKIQAIEEKKVLTRRDELAVIQEELALLGDGFTADGKDLTNQVKSLQLKKEQIEAQRELILLASNQSAIQADLKEHGASNLQLAIQELAYLNAINATYEERVKASEKVNALAAEEYKGVQDQIIGAILSEQKAIGDTAIQQVQNKIALEAQLGIHLQGIDALKEQLDLYKAINEQQNKTPLERAKELRDLIKKTHSPDEFKETDRTRSIEDQLTKQATKKGISQDTIDAILHPDRSSVDQGGDNSLQTILRNTLADPLNRNIGDLSSTIKLLADAINKPAVGPNLGAHGLAYRNPEGPGITAAQAAQANVPSYAQSFRGKDVTVDLGGINVTVHAHTKAELKNELSSIVKELIANHMVQPGSKMNAAIKKVIDQF